LCALIHAHVRVAIETVVHDELTIALGAGRYEGHGERRGYPNGVKTHTLTGPTRSPSVRRSSRPDWRPYLSRVPTSPRHQSRSGTQTRRDTPTAETP